jgi:N6-adenosine-specific RNA methylase IME4
VISVLCADPPWLFRDRLPGPGRGAVKHYRCMTTDAICAMDIPTRNDPRSVLFLWRVASMQEDALRVARAWGYTVKSELVWRKATVSGKRAFSMGHYVRGEHETCLIATRGTGCTSRDRKIRSTFDAPIGPHSAKPDAFYNIVRRMYPDAVKYELFARTVRKDFVQFGDELGSLGEEVAHV